MDVLSTATCQVAALEAFKFSGVWWSLSDTIPSITLMQKKKNLWSVLEYLAVEMCKDVFAVAGMALWSETGWSPHVHAARISLVFLWTSSLKIQVGWVHFVMALGFLCPKEEWLHALRSLYDQEVMCLPKVNEHSCGVFFGSMPLIEAKTPKEGHPEYSPGPQECSHFNVYRSAGQRTSVSRTDQKKNLWAERKANLSNW